jgi:uncharacterized membrane protein YiaA
MKQNNLQIWSRADVIFAVGCCILAGAGFLNYGGVAMRFVYPAVLTVTAFSALHQLLKRHPSDDEENEGKYYGRCQVLLLVCAALAVGILFDSRRGG